MLPFKRQHINNNKKKSKEEIEPAQLGSKRPEPKAWVEPNFFSSGPEKSLHILPELRSSLEFQLTSQPAC